MVKSTEPFEEALAALDAGRLDAALRAVAPISLSPGDPWEVGVIALRALVHCLAARWQEALAALESLDAPGASPPEADNGPLLPALRGVALANLEPSESALHAGLVSLRAPRRPLPLLASPGMAELTRIFHRSGARPLEDAVLGRRPDAPASDVPASEAPANEEPVNEEPASEEPASEASASEQDPLAENPLLAAVLALSFPDPGAARDRLGRTVAAGLDLPALHLALARLSRLAGDPQAAREALSQVDVASGDPELAAWHAQERRRLEPGALAPPEGERLREVALVRDGGRVRLRTVDGLYLLAEAIGTDAPDAPADVPGAPADAPDAPADLDEGSSGHGDTPGDQEAASDGPDVMARWVSLPANPTQELLARIEDFLDAGFALDPAAIRFQPAPPALPGVQTPAPPRAGTPDEQTFALGQGLLRDFPDDAPLLRHVIALSWRLRGAAASLPLAQRDLSLLGETPEALYRLAALLYEAGWAQEAIGTLFHLEHTHGLGALSPEAWALLVEAHVLPRFASGVARELLGHAERRHPDAAPVAEARARLAFWRGDYDEALDALIPLMAAPAVPLRRAALALQIHLEGEIPGAEPLLRAAEARYAQDPLIAAARHELEGHASAALSAYRAAAEGAPAVGALEGQLYAMRAACRLSQFEEGLRLARNLQTRMGAPDPRCLASIHECLTALEPGEARDDLAEMTREARRRAEQSGLTSQVQREAMLSAGLYLDPDLLAGLWSAGPAPGDLPEQDAIPSADPHLADAVVVCATGTGAALLCDPHWVARHTAEQEAPWLGIPETVSALLQSGVLALAPSPAPAGPLYVRLTTAPLPAPEQPLYAETYRGTVAIPTGQLYLGPAEALLPDPEEEEDPLALPIELGGRLRRVPPGRYGVRVYARTEAPWPQAPTAPDPCDVIFRLEAVPR